ncbi:MAG: hypothetical protein KGN31_06200 [Betaproteobacteria bacterium]|nr:hypothetical protein [Betaproteobacteria bacterium]MDE2423787.1 hypothetical protein [Betaproteobacteria bacterium]
MNKWIFIIAMLSAVFTTNSYAEGWRGGEGWGGHERWHEAHEGYGGIEGFGAGLIGGLAAGLVAPQPVYVPPPAYYTYPRYVQPQAVYAYPPQAVYVQPAYPAPVYRGYYERDDD